MSLDVYLEFLFTKKIPGGRIIEVARKNNRKCLGLARANSSYDEASVYCQSRRLSFLRVNLQACNRSARPQKCQELVSNEIDRIEDIVQLHKRRIQAKDNEEYNS